MVCPKCGSKHTKKKGGTYKKEQKYQCNTCKYQFTENPGNRIISDETKELMDSLLLERISLAGIARVTTVSEKWLQDDVNDKYKHIPRTVEVTDKPKGEFTIAKVHHL